MTIARALSRLADRAETAVSDAGAFEPVEEPVPVDEPGWRMGAVSVRIAPYPHAGPGSDPKNRRYALVRVQTPSGGSESTQWLTAGPKHEVLAYLRSTEAPEKVRRLMHELADSLRRHELP